MHYHKTSSLVESGILAAVAVLFTLVGNYIPVLDIIVSILWPLPIILCGRRNGLKWSILCLLVTGCVVAVLLSPLQALTQCVILGSSAFLWAMPWKNRCRHPDSAHGEPGSPAVHGAQRPGGVFLHARECDRSVLPVHRRIGEHEQRDLPDPGDEGDDRCPAGPAEKDVRADPAGGGAAQRAHYRHCQLLGGPEDPGTDGGLLPLVPALFPVAAAQMAAAALRHRDDADLLWPELSGFPGVPGRVHPVYDDEHAAPGPGAEPDPLVCGIPSLSPDPAAPESAADLYPAHRLPAGGGAGGL